MWNSVQLLSATGVANRLKLLLPLCLIAACCLIAPGARGATIITLTQSAAKDAGTTSSSSLAFNTSNTAGNFIAVCVRAGRSGQVFTIGDTRGNIYRRAVQFNQTLDAPNGDTFAIYYAENISTGPNIISVSDTILGTMRFAILEYSGVATTNSLDATAAAQGSGISLSSGTATTTTNGDLLLGEVVTAGGLTFTAGSGYTIRNIVPAAPATKLIVQDAVQTIAGAAFVGATLSISDNGGAALAAFKAASGTVAQAPAISSLNPVSGLVGTTVTILGTNFGATQGTNTVSFNGVATLPASWGTTSIVVPVPAGATSGNVVVTVGGAASNGASFVVTVLAPSITNLNPTSGVQGTMVTSAGANFGPTQGTSVVKFNGVVATPISWSATSIAMPVPAGATTGNAVVTVGGVASNGVNFTVTIPGPSIASLNPTAGLVGASVTVTGANFGTTQGTSTVTFNGTTATPTSWSATSIVAPVPAGTTTGNVVVAVGGVASNGVNFTVTIPGPSITSLNPTAGLVGASVTITGANFGTTQGTSTVTFNGTTATPTSWSATSIVAPVPAGTTTGNVVVNVGGVASAGVAFTVSTSTANIALVQHTSKDAGITNSSPLAFLVNNTASNWIGVVIRAGHAGQVFTVSDSLGSTYRQAVQFSQTLDTPNGHTFAIYYAENIAGGANTVTVADSIASNTLRFVILEYSGVAKTNSLDVTAAAQGSGTPLNSGTATTTAAGDLLLAIASTANGVTYTGGNGYTIEERVPAAPNTKLIAEDAIQTVAGAVSASAALSTSTNGGVALAAFKAAAGGGTSGPPSITSLNPTSGLIGASVTITGANFGATQGASTVKFNGATAMPANWGAGSIVVPVPAGATTGNVMVTVGGVASNGASFTVQADTTPPVVTITAPTNGASVSGTITVTATATDPDSAVSFVQFLVDGANTGTQLTTAPYSLSLDTTTLSNGAHTLTAAAQDPAGNLGTSAGVTVTVSNSVGTGAKGPLRALPGNPHYFTDGSGKAILLTGSQTWDSFQDLDQSSSPAPVDFNAYVNFLKSHGHNVTILWRKDLPTYCNWGAGGTWHIKQFPWMRTGGSSGNQVASDGLPAFDLTQLDQTYFDRLRARASQLQQNGIYAIVELFDGLGLASNRCGNDGYPLTGGNNINGVDDGGGTNSMTMGSPNAITAIQEAYVKKVIDTLNDLPNVIYEPSEEAPSGVKSFWMPFMIDLIHNYEGGGTLTQTGEVFSAKALQHPVLYASTQDLSSDSTLNNSNAEVVAPAARPSPTSSCGSGTPACKVNVNDSDHSYFGMWNDSAQTNRNYVWENFANGNSMMFMDPYLIYWTTGNRNLCQSPLNGVCSGPDSRWNNMRDNLGYTLNYANKMDLAKMTPQGSLSSTGFCLAQTPSAGAEYLVYAPNGGTFTVDLTAMPSSRTLNVEWFDPGNGTTTSGAAITGGSTKSFTPPFSGDAVLYLVDAVGHS